MCSISDRAKRQRPIFENLAAEVMPSGSPALPPRTGDCQKIRSGLCVIPYERNQVQRSGPGFDNGFAP
jgi:hypothetical protein